MGLLEMVVSQNGFVAFKLKSINGKLLFTRSHWLKSPRSPNEWLLEGAVQQNAMPKENDHSQ
jgi:hypothetical protein